MKKECFDCENENLMRVAELEIENERLKEWRYQLERSIEHNNKIMDMLREENEELSNKLRIYQEHCKNLKKENEPEEQEEEMPQKTVKEQVDSILDDLVRTLGKMEFQG